MSNYYASATHPVTGEVQRVEMLDDHYGRHQYGVRFPNGDIFPVDDVTFPGDAEMAKAIKEAPTGVHYAKPSDNSITPMQLIDAFNDKWTDDSGSQFLKSTCHLDDVVELINAIREIDRQYYSEIAGKFKESPIWDVKTVASKIEIAIKESII